MQPLKKDQKLSGVEFVQKRIMILQPYGGHHMRRDGIKRRLVAGWMAWYTSISRIKIH